jgi:hypothetical protein
MPDPLFARALSSDLPTPAWEATPRGYLESDTGASLPPLFLTDVLDMLAGLLGERLARGRFGAQTPQRPIGIQQDRIGFADDQTKPRSPWTRQTAGGMGVGGLGDAYYRAGGGWYM